METRLLAIMLTDISGYTEFSSKADRAGVVAAVRQQQAFILPLIERYRGRLVKWIGDAALAVFSSATDAVLCGRSIQQEFIENAERGKIAINPLVKVVVHAGDVNLDQDGDIYGDPVNFTARMEKAASPDEVYFSETVRQLLSRAEIPHERAGEYEFKGIEGRAVVYRTCFGQTPVVRERITLAHTAFVGVQDLADRLGWDAVHPVLDAATGAIIEATRKSGGTNRGVTPVGCLLSFPDVRSALLAARGWTETLAALPAASVPRDEIKVRAALHWGTLHVMKYTMMGRDLDILRTLVALGEGEEILFTEDAAQVALAEGLAQGLLAPVPADHLRESASRSRWARKFAGTPIHKLPLARLGDAVAAPV